MHGTVRQSHATRTDGTVPCIRVWDRPTCPICPIRVWDSPVRVWDSPIRVYIYIAIIIDHPVPWNFTGILWHWIIYFTLNNIQTPMNMYYLTVKMDLCPNKHATKATTAISVV